MTRVYVSAIIPAPASTVWRVVRDFNGLPDWTPFVTASRIEGNQPADQIGCVRNFQLNDGSTIRERLLGLSDFDMTCTYAILESGMEVRDYVATLALLPVTDGNRTFASWEATFDCDPQAEAQLVERIGTTVFQAAFSALKQQLHAA